MKGFVVYMVKFYIFIFLYFDEFYFLFLFMEVMN